MLIPLRCDAPLYHGPWGTVGMIALCFLLHVTVGSSDAIESWLLEYGAWNPLQWVSSVLVHDGWLHLLGNMVFFWVFGLIVEGKVGWWRFLLILFSIAVVAGAIEQTIMLGAEGGSLGLSGVIFGLIAIAWLWAPENEVDVLVLMLPIIRHFDVKVRNLGLIYIGLEVLSAALDGFRMSTPMLHLLGALAGVPIGIVMLRQRWVDCEGWDWFSRRQQPVRPARKPTVRASTVVASVPPVATLDELVASGQLKQAMEAWRREPAASLPTLVRLAGKLVAAQQWEEAEAVASAVIQRDAAHANGRLLKAWILVNTNRPAAALEILNGVIAGNPTEAAKLEHIRRVAEERKASNPYELA